MMTLLRNSLLILAVIGSSTVSATTLPAELASTEEAFIKACSTRGKDELRAYQATLYMQQKRCADADDFDSAKLFKEAREEAQISPELIEESLREGADSVRPLRETVWQREHYRQCISPLGYMCARVNGQWERGDKRVIPTVSTPRILEFSNNSPTLVWVLVDKNTALQVSIGWSAIVFRPATDCSYSSVISERSAAPVFRTESKVMLIGEARRVLLKGLGVLCQPIAKKYAAYLQGQLPRYAKQGRYDDLMQIQNRIASISGRRRSSGSKAALPDDSLKGRYVRESEGGHRKIPDRQPLVITRPESFELKDINGRVHQFTLKQSTPDGYLHWYDISPAFVAANKAIVGRAANKLYLILYKDALNPTGGNDYIRFYAQ